MTGNKVSFHTDGVDSVLSIKVNPQYIRGGRSSNLNEVNLINYKYVDIGDFG